jgi:hypothetical protein
MNANELGIELGEFIVDEIRREVIPEYRQILINRILDALKREFPGCLPKPPASQPPTKSIKPMSELEAIAFEKKTIKIGKYKGYQVGDVEFSYWDHIVIPDPFIEQVERYLLSERVRLIRLREEEE